MKPTARVAILAHSTNPRGGVVHALELGDALSRLGFEATVLAPDAAGVGFFRATLCATVCVAGSPVGRGVRSMVETRVADYVRHFEHTEHRRLRPVARSGRHFRKCAGDPEGARPDLRLRAHRSSRRYFRRRVRARVATARDQSGRSPVRRRPAMARLAYSRTRSRRLLCRQWRRSKPLLDRRRMPPTIELRARLESAARRAGISWRIGGVEERKNTIRLLQAFQALRLQHPSARLVIAGGASLLDHDAYQARFAGVLAHCGATADAVIRTGPLRQKLMPALYRAATCFV